MVKAWKHIKSGNDYIVLNDEVENKTSGEQDSQVMVLYKREGKYYVRERVEFFEKFDPYEIVNEDILPKDVVEQIKGLRNSIHHSGHRTFSTANGMRFIDELLEKLEKYHSQANKER